MTESDRTERLRSTSKHFAIGILKLFGKLSKTPEVHAIETPLVKSATALAANCRGLARSGSEDDCVTKSGHAAGDADDCLFWLELLAAAGTDQEQAIQALVVEVTEIAALLATYRQPDTPPPEEAQPQGSPAPQPTPPPSPTPQPGDFHRLRVLSFESRMAKEMARLIQRHGGIASVVPALREVPIPLQDNGGAVFRLGVKLILHQVDILILMTGVGTKALFDALQTRYPLAELIEALKRVIVVTRGPKPLAALKTLGIESNITVPEPNTWQDVIATLDYYRPVQGLRIAVQEYGISNPSMIQDLKTRGAEVFAVPIYRWALPEDTGPLKRAIGEILKGEIDVILITNAAQVDHVIQLVEQEKRLEEFMAACKSTVIASIGPTASDRLTHYELPVDFEPSHPKMGILVKELAEQVHALRQSKTLS